MKKERRRGKRSAEDEEYKVSFGMSEERNIEKENRNKERRYLASNLEKRK